MPSKRDRRRAILSDVPDEPHAPAVLKPIQFGSPRRPADLCTLYDAPAQFSLCLDCHYNQGARGGGILCGHRFGLDPTVVGGIKTQFKGDSILPLDE